jgi:hypothetical protein
MDVPIGPRLGYEFRKALKKILTILVTQEYLATLDAPNHDVMHNTGSVKSG